MTEDQIKAFEQLKDKNVRLLYLLGYAKAIVVKHVSEKDPQLKWLLKACDDVIYKDKPLPEPLS